MTTFRLARFLARAGVASRRGAAELVAAGSVRLESLVTHRYPIAEGDEAFRALTERRGIKVIVEP